jgi:hypothetical protein
MKKMPAQSDVRDPKHFIAKHGLDAFEAMPNYIWRTGKGPNELPHRFNQLKVGDRWIGFAYTTSDRQERTLSLVTGFYECTSEASFHEIPLSGQAASDGEKYAWLIEGKPFGEQPSTTVGVPPIDELLGRPTWKNQGIVPISGEDLDRIRRHVISHQFDPKKIPFFGREPRNEQELLAIVVHGHAQIGIAKIVRIGKAFPDLLVQFEGSSEEVHLELELYSEGFFSHGHDEHVLNGRYKRDDKRVAVLCWIETNKQVRKQVPVFELQSLIRENKKVVW